MTGLGPSSLDAGDQGLSVDAARAAIAAALRPITDTECVPLHQALGRVLAADVVSPINVPAHDNSAMDGYAFAGRHGDLALKVIGTALAGLPFNGNVGDGHCVRIMTGAVMPPGLDTVVPQELCRVADGVVQMGAGTVRPGDNCRKRGEDLAAGSTALAAGRVLKPADMGLLASLGLADVTVLRRLRVALFSTGSELRLAGEQLPAGCIYDSNRLSLMGALQRLGMDVIDLGLVADDAAALRAALSSAAGQADVVLTSGGVSAGDADHTRAVLAQLGEVAFWQVAMRPGRPFAFGPLRQAAGRPPAWLFALPGNPVAALVSFYVLVRDALLRLAGAQPQPLPLLQVRSATGIRKRLGRTEFQRGTVETTAGGWQVRVAASQSAGVLRSMSQANALVVLGPELDGVAAGALVDVWLFDGWV